MSFAELGLIGPLCQNLDRLGLHTPTPVQAQAIAPILKGRDVLAAAQTGTGKTAGFVLPIVQRLLSQGAAPTANHVRALILAPTRELAEQIYSDVRQFTEGLPIRSVVAYGGVSINPQMMALRSGRDILVATPGRLLDLIRQNALRLRQVETLVLDEADRMLDLGFRDELSEVFHHLPKAPQVLLFSATFADGILQLAERYQRDPVRIQISPRNTAAPKIKQTVIPVDKRRKTELFLSLYAERAWSQVLVFCKTRKGAEALVQALAENGIAADSLHGDRTQAARLQALQDFKQGAVRILVATDVAARGLDIEDLPLVVNLDMPTVAEDYVHRIGRTGRAGREGQAVSLVSADEVDQLAAVETLLGRLLPRAEEPDFEPEHRVPQTTLGGVIVKKPKKPKVKAGSNKDRIHLGNWFDSAEAPQVKSVRPKPSLGSKQGSGSSKKR